jgi:hypothetical protein
MNILSYFGSKGYNHGQFNKIKDMETFIFNNDHLLLVVDHRNHRLELFKINNILEFEYLTTYNGGNETLCLPSNILYIGNGMFLCSEIQDHNRIQIISIYQEDCVYKIKQYFTLTGCESPGGMSLYKNIIFIPEYTYNSIYICKLFNNNFALNPINRFVNKYLQNPIDSIVIKNKLFVIDCKLNDLSDQSIIVFNINDTNFDLEYETEITNAYGIKFNFSNSSGAISTCNFNDIDYILIADSKNDRILIATINFNQHNNVIIEFQTQFKNNIVFPTSICIGQDNTILCSCFHHNDKIELDDHDKIVCLNFNQLLIKELKLNILINLNCPSIPVYNDLNDNDFLDNIIIDKIEKTLDKIFIRSSNKIITLINRNDKLFLDNISFNYSYEKMDIDYLIDIELDENMNLPQYLHLEDINVMKLIYLNDRRHILRRFNPKILHRYLISSCEYKINYKEISINNINYYIFTYNPQLQINMNEWTLGILSTRGLVMNNLNIVATPFPKIWTYNYDKKSNKIVCGTGVEISYLNQKLIDIGGQFYLEENVNGILVIIFWNSISWIATTKESFNSPQAIKVTEWLKEYEIILPNKDTTYLMKIIYSLNKQPALILLTGYNKLGYELKSYELNDIIMMQNEKIEKRLFNRVPLEQLQQYIDTANIKITNSKLKSSIVFRRPIQTINLQNYEETMTIISTLPCNYDGMIAIWNYNNGILCRIKIKIDITCDFQQTIEKYTPKESNEIYINDPNKYNELILNADDENSKILIKWKEYMDTKYIEIVDNIKINLGMNEDILLNYKYKNVLLKIKSCESDWTINEDIQKSIRKYIVLDVKDNNIIIDKIEENNGNGKSLVEFMNDLFSYIYPIVLNNIKLTIIKMKQYLKEHYFHIFNIIDEINRVYIIKYIEGSKIWTSWSRKARGTILYLDDTLHFRILQQLLDRGVEVLTTMHIKQNILSTLDINKYNNSEDNFLEFTKDQQETMNMIIKNEEFPGYLSMNVDGLLSAVNVYHKGTCDCVFIEQLIDTLPVKFYKIIKDLCNPIEYLIIPSSNESLFFDYNPIINNDKLNWSWNIGAIICGFLNINENDIKQDISSNIDESIEILIKKYFPLFIEKIVNFIRLLNLSKNIITLIFESVCKDKTDIFGNIHYELAITYNRYMYRILGLNHNIGDNSGTFIPHCDNMVQLKLNECRKGFKNEFFAWEDPLFWKQDKISDKYINELMDSLQDIMNNNITVFDFCKLFPPDNNRMKYYNNKYYSDDIINEDIQELYKDLDPIKMFNLVSKYDIYNNELIDYKGFILYRKMESGLLDYSKVKHPLFYHLQNINLKETNKLLKLNNLIDKIYPNLRKLRIFNNQFTNLMYEVTNNIINEFIIPLGLIHGHPINDYSVTKLLDINVTIYKTLQSVSERWEYLLKHVNINALIYNNIKIKFLSQLNTFNINLITHINLAIRFKNINYISIIYVYQYDIFNDNSWLPTEYRKKYNSLSSIKLALCNSDIDDKLLDLALCRFFMLLHQPKKKMRQQILKSPYLRLLL